MKIDGIEGKSENNGWGCYKKVERCLKNGILRLEDM